MIWFLLKVIRVLNSKLRWGVYEMSVDELKDGMRIKHPAWEEIWVVRMVGSDFRLVCDEIGIEIGLKDLSEAYPLKEYKQI